MNYDAWKTRSPDDDRWIEDDDMPETEADAWEYWHQRAIRFEKILREVEHSSRCNSGGFLDKAALLQVVRRHGEIIRAAIAKTEGKP